MRASTTILGRICRKPTSRRSSLPTRISRLSFRARSARACLQLRLCSGQSRSSAATAAPLISISPPRRRNSCQGTHPSLVADRLLYLLQNREGSAFKIGVSLDPARRSAALPQAIDLRQSVQVTVSPLKNTILKKPRICPLKSLQINALPNPNTMTARKGQHGIECRTWHRVQIVPPTMPYKRGAWRCENLPDSAGLRIEKARSYAGLEVVSCSFVPVHAGRGITPTRWCRAACWSRHRRRG